MSTKTTNLNIIKPADNESADIQVINGNMDILDEAVAGKMSKSLATAEDQVLVSTGIGAWAVKTLAAFKTWLGLKSAAYTESSEYVSTSDFDAHKTDLVTDSDGAHGLKIESGTWTPKFSPGNHTYSTQDGTYYKIGKMVVARFIISLTTKDTGASGAICIEGLPFTPKGTTTVNFSHLYHISLSTNYIQYAGKLYNAGGIAMIQFSNGSYDIIPFTNLTNGAEAYGQVTYFID